MEKDPSRPSSPPGALAAQGLPAFVHQHQRQRQQQHGDDQLQGRHGTARPGQQGTALGHDAQHQGGERHQQHEEHGQQEHAVAAGKVLEPAGHGQGTKKTKVLLPTDKGKALITVMPEEIQSADMTADWEAKLLQIERSEMEPSEFMTEINTMITELVKNTEMKKGVNALMKKQNHWCLSELR